MKYLLFVVAVAALTACSSSSSSTQAAEQATPVGVTITATSKSPEAITHFHKGELLFDNLRTTEAAEEFAQAIALDPDFVLAHVYHGLVTPGPDGLKEIEVAAAAVGRLPEPERMLIEGAAEDELCKWQGVVTADKAGDKARAVSAREQVLKNFLRDPLHLIVRSPLTTPST